MLRHSYFYVERLEWRSRLTSAKRKRIIGKELDMGIQLGNLLIPYYGLFIVMGIGAAALLGWIQVRVFGMDYDDFITIAGFVGIGAILGAKLLYLAVSWHQIDVSRLTDLAYLNAIMSGGFVFYGGLFGGLIGLAACRKIFKIDVISYVNIAVPCVPLAHAFGRFGCNYVGCCYGIPYHGFGAVTYRQSLFAPNHISLFPVQKLEAVLDVVIAIVLLIYINTNKEKKKHSLLVYLICYAVIRFILEFFRYDNAERGVFLQFSTSQWCSILILLGTVVWLCVQKYKQIRL